MCNLSEGVERRGIEKGIGILIQTLRSFSISDEVIVEKLMGGYQLSAEAAKSFMVEQVEIS